MHLICTRHLISERLSTNSWFQPGSVKFILLCKYSCKKKNYTFNPFNTRPHQNVVSIQKFLIRFSKNCELCTKRKREKILQKMSPHLSQLNDAMARRNYFRRNNLRILKLATYTKITIYKDHYSRCKLTTF